MIYSPSPVTTQQSTVFGHSIVELSNRFGTPLLAFDAPTIRETLSAFAAFDSVRVCNRRGLSEGVLGVVAAGGFAVAGTNASELRQGISRRMTRVICDTDFLDRETVAVVAEHGLHVVCGSVDMIDQVGQVRPGADVSLRVDLCGDDSCDGIPHDQIEDCLFRADQYGVMVTGLAFDVSKISTADVVAMIGSRAQHAATVIGRTLSSLCVVGELTGESFPVWDNVRRAIANDIGHAVRLDVRIDQSVFAPAGTLIAEIRAIVRRGNHWLYRAAIPDVESFSEAVVRGEKPISICPRQAIDYARPVMDVILGGQGDVAVGADAISNSLPVAVIGDFAVIGHCGDEYSAATASTVGVSIVLVDGENVSHCRPRMN